MAFGTADTSSGARGKTIGGLGWGTADGALMIRKLRGDIVPGVQPIVKGEDKKKQVDIKERRECTYVQVGQDGGGRGRPQASFGHRPEASLKLVAEVLEGISGKTGGAGVLGLPVESSAREGPVPERPADSVVPVCGRFGGRRQSAGATRPGGSAPASQTGLTRWGPMGSKNNMRDMPCG